MFRLIAKIWLGLVAIIVILFVGLIIYESWPGSLVIIGFILFMAITGWAIGAAIKYE